MSNEVGWLKVDREKNKNGECSRQELECGEFLSPQHAVELNGPWGEERFFCSALTVCGEQNDLSDICA